MSEKSQRFLGRRGLESRGLDSTASRTGAEAELTKEMEAELTKEGSEEEVAAFLRNKVGIDEGKIESMKGHTKLKGRMNGKLLFMANANFRGKIDKILEEGCAWDDFDTAMMWSAIDELKDENKGSAMAAVAAKAATEAVAAQSTSLRPAKRAKKDEGLYSPGQGELSRLHRNNAPTLTQLTVNPFTAGALLDNTTSPNEKVQILTAPPLTACL